MTEDKEIRERWKSYFEKLYNMRHVVDFEDLDLTMEPNAEYTRNIRVLDVILALRKMKIGKACDPDEIPIEVWKVLGEVGVLWLTKLFNGIINTKYMPDA